MEGTLRVARQYEGLHEAKNKAELQELLGIDPVATSWCSHFVHTVLKHCGYDVPAGAGRAESWKDWGEECDPPEAGCVVVFQGHVAFLDSDTDKILGGNQSNAVNSSLISWFGETGRLQESNPNLSDPRHRRTRRRLNG